MFMSFMKLDFCFNIPCEFMQNVKPYDVWTLRYQPSILTVTKFFSLGLGDRFKNTYELLNLGARTSHMLCHGKDIMCVISTGTFGILHKISYPNTERWVFVSEIILNELLDYRVHNRFWNSQFVGSVYNLCTTSIDRFLHLIVHDAIIKWKHFPRYWTFVRGIPRSPVNSLHRGQRRGALMFSLICAWTNSWGHCGDACDFRRQRALWRHCNVADITKFWPAQVTMES